MTAPQPLPGLTERVKEGTKCPPHSSKQFQASKQAEIQSVVWFLKPWEVNSDPDLPSSTLGGWSAVSLSQARVHMLAGL